MPVLLLLLSGAGLGAYFGAQLDDKFEKPTPQDPVSLSPTKIAYYAAIGMGLFWIAKKTNVLK